MKIFGEYIDLEELSECHEYLRLQFSPSSIPLKQRWRNNGLSADFMADYFATFFPQFDRLIEGAKFEYEFRHAVSYVANELLENAMKFSNTTTSYPVDITFQLHGKKIIFFVKNSIQPDKLNEFQAFIQQVLTEDPFELYIQHLEKSAENDTIKTSGLGILTMMNDYHAKIGWKFETVRSEPLVIAVTTMVQLMFE